MIKNGFGQSDHLKKNWMYLKNEQMEFEFAQKFACWYKIAKPKSWFNDFWVWSKMAMAFF